MLFLLSPAKALDYDTPCPPVCRTPYQFWGRRISDYLNGQLPPTARTLRADKAHSLEASLLAIKSKTNRRNDWRNLASDILEHR